MTERKVFFYCSKGKTFCMFIALAWSGCYTVGLSILCVLIIKEHANQNANDYTFNFLVTMCACAPQHPSAAVTLLPKPKTQPHTLILNRLVGWLPQFSTKRVCLTSNRLHRQPEARAQEHYRKLYLIKSKWFSLLSFIYDSLRCVLTKFYAIDWILIIFLTLNFIQLINVQPTEMTYTLYGCTLSWHRFDKWNPHYDFFTRQKSTT